MELRSQVNEYYAVMAPVYDRNAGYNDQESEKLREFSRTSYQELFKNKRVLEIACGTGYWTEIIGQTAKSVLATDINPSMLSIAEKRCNYLPNVDFLQTDAYSLTDVHRDFDAAFSHWWWSHMPKKLIPLFLKSLHSKLEPGSKVLFVDQLLSTVGFCAKNATQIKYQDGNRLEQRITPDGKLYNVVKNLPTEKEIRGYLAESVYNLSYREENGVWKLSYEIK